MANYKYVRIVGADCFLVNNCVLYKEITTYSESVTTNENGEEVTEYVPSSEWVLENITLEEGQFIVEPRAPESLITPKWDVESESWVEGASEESVDEAAQQVLETAIESKVNALSSSCYDAIVDGCDATLTDGSVEHFAMTETDQINITTAVTAVTLGATAYPYHADGQLCRLYVADDIAIIGNAATTHKMWHTTYCNHAMAWARRAESLDELAEIAYGADLPEDLAANMAEVLSSASDS